MYNKNKEIYEALQACDNALFYLKKANEHLNSASNWGVVDILGGSMFSTLIKHRKIDEAKEDLQLAKSAVQRLKNELLDVTELENLDINVNGFLSFADFFFDGFAVDIMFQSAISENKRLVNDAIAQINAVKITLNSMY